MKGIFLFSSKKINGSIGLVPIRSMLKVVTLLQLYMIITVSVLYLPVSVVTF